MILIKNQKGTTILIELAVVRLCDSRLIEAIFIDYFNRLGCNENGLVSESLHIDNCLNIDKSIRLSKLRSAFEFEIFLTQIFPPVTQFCS